MRLLVVSFINWVYVISVLDLLALNVILNRCLILINSIKYIQSLQSVSRPAIQKFSLHEL
jgi:hypothetical protein